MGEEAIRAKCKDARKRSNKTEAYIWFFSIYLSALLSLAIAAGFAFGQAENEKEEAQTVIVYLVFGFLIMCLGSAYFFTLL